MREKLLMFWICIIFFNNGIRLSNFEKKEIVNEFLSILRKIKNLENYNHYEWKWIK